jgi:hypothetical protein
VPLAQRHRHLIFAYLTLMQAERDEDAANVIEDEPLDRLIAAFDG